MSKVTKVIEELKWQSLKERFFIGSRIVEELVRDTNGNIVIKDGQPITRKVSKFTNELQDAIEAGIMDELLQECADKLHNGDLRAALNAFKRNLSSTKTNMNKRDTVSRADEIRLATLLEYTSKKSTPKDALGNGIPQWAYGPEQIDQIDDPDQLQKVINSISDVCSSKAYGDRYVTHLGANYREVAKANRAYARKRMKALAAAKNAISPELVAKLQKGSVRLSAADAAALLKLLGIEK